MLEHDTGIGSRSVGPFVLPSKWSYLFQVKIRMVLDGLSIAPLHVGG